MSHLVLSGRASRRLLLRPVSIKESAIARFGLVTKKNPKRNVRLGFTGCCLKLGLLTGRRGIGGWGAAQLDLICERLSTRPDVVEVDQGPTSSRQTYRRDAEYLPRSSIFHGQLDQAPRALILNGTN